MVRDLGKETTIEWNFTLFENKRVWLRGLRQVFDGSSPQLIGDVYHIFSIILVFYFYIIISIREEEWNLTNYKFEVYSILLGSIIWVCMNSGISLHNLISKSAQLVTLGCIKELEWYLFLVMNLKY